MSMLYRPEIDGLRAIAVLPVIFFHAGFSLFSGGFIGVDVFFVVSGYLIISIVLEEKDRGVFSLWRFYDRRVRRILPALLMVIAISSLISFIVMVPGQLKEFGQSVIASLAFMANIYFWLKTDYWGQSSEFTPLIHLWSLGVEEQFYLVTPLVALVSRNRIFLFAFISLLTTASFVAMFYMYSIGRDSDAFFLLPFRAWEISAGALAALLQRNLRVWPLRDEIISVSAVLALVSGMILLDSRSSPTILFGLPVFATFLLVLFCRKGVTAWLLASKPLVWVGLLSYSLYLFHQPVFVFLRFLSLKPLDISTVLLGIVVSFLLAYLTYRFVETPCRKRQIVQSRLFYLIIATGVATLVIWGVLLAKTGGLPETKLAMMDDGTRASVENLSTESALRKKIWKESLKDSKDQFDNDDSTKVIFVGDSLSQDLFVAISKTKTTDYAFRRISLDEICIRTNGERGKGHGYPTCREELDEFRSSVPLQQADWVVIASAWLSDVNELRKLLSYPEVRSKNIIIYKTHSFLDMRSIVMAASKFNSDTNSTKLQEFIYVNRHQRTLNAARNLQEIADANNLATIDGYEFFCEDPSQICQLFSPDGKPLLIDQTHLSATGVEMFREWFKEELLGKIEQANPPR